jgi:hypothetical protein
MSSEGKDREIRLHGPEEARDGWHVRAGLEFWEVEDLLDWLEACGVARREVELTQDHKGFTVRWAKENNEAGEREPRSR